MLEFFTGIIEKIIEWFPDDPFPQLINGLKATNSIIAVGLRWLNWFIPFNDMFAEWMVMLTALAIYETYKGVGKLGNLLK